MVYQGRVKEVVIVILIKTIYYYFDKDLSFLKS